MKAGKLIAIIILIAVVLAVAGYLIYQQVKVSKLAKTTTTPQQAIYALQNPAYVPGISNNTQQVIANANAGAYQYSNGGDIISKEAINAITGAIGGLFGGGSNNQDNSSDNTDYSGLADLLGGFFG